MTPPATMQWGHSPAGGWGPRTAGEYPHPLAVDEAMERSGAHDSASQVALV
jgi:hypothetical protein